MAPILGKPVKQVKAVLGAQVGKPRDPCESTPLAGLAERRPLNPGQRQNAVAWRRLDKDSHEAEIDSLAVSTRDVRRGGRGQRDASATYPANGELPRSDGSDDLR